MIGSYTSLPSMLDVIILEDEYAQYLMESGDFTLSESIQESFGHFLYQRDSFKSLDEIKEKQKEISTLRAKFYNPLLEDDEVSIETVVEEENFSTIIARRIAGEIVSAFMQLYAAENTGPVLVEIDALLSQLVYPVKRTYSPMLQVYEEIKDNPREAMNNQNTMVNKIRNEYFEFFNREKELLADKKFDMEVAISIALELSFMVPSLGIVLGQYNQQPLLSMMINELYHTIVIAEVENVDLKLG